MENFSEKFKTRFLLEFTKELIKNSKKEAIYELENVIKEKEKTKKEDIKEIVQEIEKHKREEDIVKKIHRKELVSKRIGGQIKQGIKNTTQKIAQIIPRKIPFSPKTPFQKRPQNQFQKNQFVPQRRPIVPLMIREPRLPERLSYIKPIQTEKTIDLGKLTPLLNDPMTRQIECNGPSIPIVVKTTTTKQSQVVLTKEEIDQIINNFSSASKIPVEEGVFQAAVGKFEIVAIVSKIIDTKFVIKKIVSTPRFTQKQIPQNRLMRKKF